MWLTRRVPVSQPQEYWQECRLSQTQKKNIPFHSIIDRSPFSSSVFEAVHVQRRLLILPQFCSWCPPPSLLCQLSFCMQNLPFHLFIPSLYPANRKHPKGGRKNFRSPAQADMGTKQKVSIFSTHTSSWLHLPSKVSFLLLFGRFNAPAVCHSMPPNTFCQGRIFF